MATNEDREDSSKARGTPPLMPRPGPTEVSSYQLRQLAPTQNISWPGGEFVWHAWMKCLDCRVMQLLRSGGLVYRKKQPFNHKQTVIIASRFISTGPPPLAPLLLLHPYPSPSVAPGNIQAQLHPMVWDEGGSFHMCTCKAVHQHTSTFSFLWQEFCWLSMESRWLSIPSGKPESVPKTRSDIHFHSEAKLGQKGTTQNITFPASPLSVNQWLMTKPEVDF